MDMYDDLTVIVELKRLNSDEIHRVFFNVLSIYRRRMEEVIKDNWKITDEDFTLIILSFVQYLTNNGCNELNKMYESLNKEGKKLDFHTLLLAKLYDYLSSRQSYKDQRHLIYNTLIDVTISTPTMRVLRKTKELKEFLWGQDGIMFDTDIQQAAKNLNRQFQQKQSLDAQTIKEELRKALCIHPEMVLCSYDFSDTLDNWREGTAKRIISQICDIHIIKSLQKQDQTVTQKVFFSDSDYRSGIDWAIKDSWALGEDDLTAVVNSFVYHLIVRNDGSKLKQLSKRIVRDIPYIKLPMLSSSYQPKTWKRYEDGRLHSLLQEGAHTYAEERSSFKEERIELQRLFNLSEEERVHNFVQNKSYDEKINKAIVSHKNKHGQPIDTDIIKNRLKHFLCDALKATLARYDFQQGLSQWLETITNNMIADLIKVQSLMDPQWGMSVLDKDYRGFIKKKASTFQIDGKPFADEDEKVIDDLLQELFLILWADNKKVLNDFQFNSRLRTYINSIAYHLIIKNVDLLKNQKVAEKAFGKAEQKPKRMTQKEKQEKYTIKLKELAITYKALFEILRNPSYRKTLNIRAKFTKVQELQFRLIEEAFVGLTEFTRKEQTLVKKRLFEELYVERSIDDAQDGFNGQRRATSQNLLDQHVKRAQKFLSEVKTKIDIIMKSDNPSPQQKDLLDDFQRAITNAFVSQLKQEPNE